MGTPNSPARGARTWRVQRGIRYGVDDDLAAEPVASAELRERPEVPDEQVGLQPIHGILSDVDDVTALRQRCMQMGALADELDALARALSQDLRAEDAG